MILLETCFEKLVTNKATHWPGEFLEERPSGAPPLATRYLGKLQITGKKQHSADSFAARLHRQEDEDESRVIFIWSICIIRLTLMSHGPDVRLQTMFLGVRQPVALFPLQETWRSSWLRWQVGSWADHSEDFLWHMFISWTLISGSKSTWINTGKISANQKHSIELWKELMGCWKGACRWGLATTNAPLQLRTWKSYFTARNLLRFLFKFHNLANLLNSKSSNHLHLHMLRGWFWQWGSQNPPDDMQ